VLLVGAGAFGRQHLVEWQALQREGLVDLAGVVVRSADSAAALAAACPGLAVHAGLHDELLAGVDAVDIATPAHAHAALVAQCLPHADVICEKPLGGDADTARRLFALARRHGHRLQACHNYLRNPVVQALQAELLAASTPPQTLRIHLSNPADRAPAGEACPFEEWLHAFYLLQVLTTQGLPAPSALAPQALSAWRSARAADISLALPGGTRAHLGIGWRGHQRQRCLELAWPDRQLRADLDDGQLVLLQRGRSERRLFGCAYVSLRAELRAFALAVGSGADPADGQPVVDVLSLMARARRAAMRPPAPAGKARRDRPRVLVVGGGVFGTTCAAELALEHDVVLVERHDRLLTEASWLNQWRHHSGFHYPRSLETIEEVRACKADFESVYEPAIARDVNAYYAVSALGHEITRERYLAVCDANRLQYRIVEPPADVVHPHLLRVCLHTDEAVVRIDKLSRLLGRRLQGADGAHGVDLRMATRVLGGRLLADGAKSLRLRGPGGNTTERFDFVVNATYAGTNAIAGWFGFPLRPMRFDLLEMAVFSIPGAPRFMMTILDGPFTSLTHTGRGDHFMLSHIHQSILASQVTADGLPPHWGPPRSNREGLLAHGLRYLPILERARFVESRIGVRTVEAYSEDFDGRPTVVTAHGFGCWSVLGGKIITAVSNAREIVQAVSRESRGGA
jgi:predicted dehydrogenase/glycine/D-amino acid oxidase-like deaminating enzyme